MFPSTQISGTPNNPHVSHGSDQNLVVRFYFNKIHEKHFVKINIPGDQKTEYDRPASEIDKRRFKERWDKYIANQTQTDGQTPLEELGINDSQVEHYRQFHITTVEQLANLSDTFVTQVGMGTRELQKKALNYLNDIQARKTVTALEDQKRHLENQNAVLKTKIEELTARMDAMEKPKPRNKKNDTA